MSEVDHHVGRIIDYLKGSGHYDHTLIIFTSDHAGHLGDHHLQGKSGYFDEAFHIPLIIRDPYAAAKGARGGAIDAFTENVDIMPTILDWIGREVPAQCDGATLMPFPQRRVAGQLAVRGALGVRLAKRAGAFR